MVFIVKTRERFFAFKYYLIFTLIFVLMSKSFPNNVTDSLLLQIRKAQGPDRISLLNQIAKKTNPNSPADGLKYANEALHLAERFDDKNGIAEAYNMIAYSWLYRGRYDSALQYYYKSEEVCKELDDPERNGNLYFSLGQVYYIKGNISLGMDYYFKAMNIFESLNHINGLAKSMYSIGYMHYDFGRYDSALYYFNRGIKISENIIDCESITTSLCNGAGNVFYEWGQYKKAIAYYNRALDLNRKINNKPGIAYSINNLGNVYYDWRKYDSAFMNYNNALSIFQEVDNLKGQAIELHNMGLICDATSNNEAALSHYKKALKIYKEIGQPSGIAKTLNEMGESYKKAKNYRMAIEIINQSQEYALKNNLAEVIYDNYHILSVAYSETGKPELALQYYKKYTAVKDSIFNEKTQQQITELETRYETEKKEQQILLLEKENLLFSDRAMKSRIVLIALGSFILLLILLVLLYLQRNKLKNQQEKTNLQQKLLRSQMNPHFIFNSLSSVQNAIINDQPAMANRYLSRFSKLMRNILESSAAETISLDKELTTIKNYLALQKVRFPEKFQYNISVDENIDINSLNIPPMLTQPFIENAIEHGFKLADTPGQINISFSLQNNLLYVEVEDDGIGRQKAGELKQKGPKDYKSMATDITRQRISSLNKGRKQKIAMEIIDLKDDTGQASGTMVRFGIPVGKV